MTTAKFLPYKISFLLYIFSEQIAHLRVQSYHHILAGGKSIIKENAKIGAIVGEKGRKYPKGSFCVVFRIFADFISRCRFLLLFTKGL